MFHMYMYDYMYTMLRPTLNGSDEILLALLLSKYCYVILCSNALPVTRRV